MYQEDTVIYILKLITLFILINSQTEALVLNKIFFCFIIFLKQFDCPGGAVVAFAITALLGVSYVLFVFLSVKEVWHL